MKRARVSLTLFVAVLCLAVLHCSLAQLQAVNIVRAVENLAARFEAIKNEGLGVNTLEERYNNAEYTFSSLDSSSIDRMLSDSSTATSINSVLSLFNSFSTDSTSSSPVSPVDCCSPQNSTDVCCFFCEDADTTLVNKIAGAYSEPNPQAGTLQFLMSDGPLISRPHMPPFNESVCEEQDARLQPSYQSAVRNRALEVVMMLDIDVNTPVGSQATIDTVATLKDAVRLVLGSLGTDDRVGIIGVDSASSIPPIISRLSPTSTKLQTVPVCDETLTELEAYVTSYTLRGSANYTDGFMNAFGLLSNSTTNDKLILFFTVGSTDLSGNPYPTFRDTTFPLIQQLSSATGNSVVISVFRMLEALQSDYNMLLMDMVSLSSIPGSITTFGTQTGARAIRIDNPLPHSIASYSPFNVTQSTAVRLGHEAGSLAISQLYYDDTDLVGVFYATLPWRQLLSHLTPSLTKRRSSYLFVVGPDRSVLYHPLLPDSRLVRLMVTDVESEGVIGDVLDMVDSQPSTTQRAAVLKRLFVPSGSLDPNGFLYRTLPSKYYCRDIGVNGHTIYLCLLLADEDVAMGSLREINDIRSVYDSTIQPPIYHNVKLASELRDSVDDVCNYFCKPSLNSTISFQLTGPDVPTDSAQLISTLTSYIEGRGSPPSWVPTGVSTEVGVASAVTSHWLNTTARASDHITRRHLVTTSGAYLTFPPVHLNRGFNPTVTEWFLSTVPRPGVLTLTPPRADVLREGGKLVVSAGYAIKAPTSQGDVNIRDSGHILSVLAADLTFTSLRAFIRDALPQCETDSRISCVIIDDLGNFIYSEELFSEAYKGGPHFIGQPLGSIDLLEYRAIIRDILRNSPNLLSKQRCVDHFNTSVKTRRFFQFNTDFNETSGNTGSGSCVDYLLQRIPGTNAFLIVRERGDCRGSLICICNSDSRCSNCELFRNSTCECPCTCSEDCERTTDILGCPQIKFEDPNFEQNEASITQDVSVEYDDNLCFNQGCNCRTDFESCFGVRECSWCEEEGVCIHYTECCDGADCCVNKPDIYGVGCLSLAGFCFNENNGQFNQTCPIPTPTSSSNTALIVAVVIGCIFGALLIALFIVFIVWYQCYRLADPKDETSRESAFDFSNKRTESTNPTALAGGSELNEKSPVNSPTNGGSEEGHLETKMDLEDTTVYDEIKS